MRVRKLVNRAQRNQRGREYRGLPAPEIRVRADNIENTGWAALGRWSNVAIIIAADGACFGGPGWFSPDALEYELDFLASAWPRNHSTQF
jgi:hypothetical protein